jgi:hypothetical protein
MMFSGCSHFRARSSRRSFGSDLTDDDWQKRRNQITADSEHRLENARDQLRTQWKEWIKQDAFKASSQAGPGALAANLSIPECDE